MTAISQSVAWPCDGTELTRRLGMEVNAENTERIVRPLLIRLGCPKKHPHYPRAAFVVDRNMALRVADPDGARSEAERAVAVELAPAPVASFVELRA